MLFFLQALLFGCAAGVVAGVVYPVYVLLRELFFVDQGDDEGGLRSSSRREPNVPFADLDVADRLDGAGDLQPVVDPSAWQSTLYLDDPRRHVGQE